MLIMHNRYRNAATAILVSTLTLMPMIEVKSAGVIDLDTPWARHTILEGAAPMFRGADGVNLANIDGKEGFEVVSGFEQSNNVAVLFHPGFGSQVKSPWLKKVVLPSPNTNFSGPEDAIFALVDGDQRRDVVVGLEAGNMVVVLFGPAPSDQMNAAMWTRMNLNVGMRAIRIAVANVAGDSRPEIVVGGKEGSMTPATIGYYSLTNPSLPRDANSWTYTPIRQVGWVMQMMVLDVEGDGDRDIVYTDRDSIDVNTPPPGPNAAMGLRWLESSSNTNPTWTDHQISTSVGDHKWFDVVKWDADNDLDIVDCRSRTSGTPIHDNFLWLNDGGWQSWTQVVIPEPMNVGDCQHITFANIDNAGALDLGITYSHAGEPLSGVIWLHNTGTAAAPVWERGEISGNQNGDGIKFDNLVWYDIDNDGDLDAVTSEQHEPNPPGPGLGVVWYENPLNP